MSECDSFSRPEVGHTAHNAVSPRARDGLARIRPAALAPHRPHHHRRARRRRGGIGVPRRVRATHALPAGCAGRAALCRSSPTPTLSRDAAVLPRPPASRPTLPDLPAPSHRSDPAPGTGPPGTIMIYGQPTSRVMKVLWMCAECGIDYEHFVGSKTTQAPPVQCDLQGDLSDRLLPAVGCSGFPQRRLGARPQPQGE